MAKGVLAVLFILGYISFSQVSGAPSRQRRSLWELNTIIACYTGRSAIQQYNGYGCWCGLGGSGKPVDRTDRCCELHDICYGILQNNQCGVYFSSYSYTKRNCDTGSGSIECTSSSACERALCECDRRLAKCLASAKNGYHEAFANFEKRFCDVNLEGIADIGYDLSSTSSAFAVVEGDERDAYQIDTAAVNSPQLAAADNTVPDAHAPAGQPVSVPVVAVGGSALQPNQTQT